MKSSIQDALSLSSESWSWNRTLEDVEHVPACQTAVFDADGKKLSVGPWIAGREDIRLQYRCSLPLRAGAICGRFRTQGLYPREANLWITTLRGEKRIAEQNYWFGVAEDWTDFCFPVFKPFSECDRVVLSLGFHMKTHGRIELSHLRFEDEHPLPAVRESEPVLTRAKAPQAFAPGEFVRLEQTQDGTWWLVDTDGKPFYSTGCAMYNNHITPEATAPTLEDLSINTIANGSSLDQWRTYNETRCALGQAPFFQFYRINTDISARSPYVGLMSAEEAVSNEDPDAGMAAIGGFNHAFPDPFDPHWEEDVRRQVREITQSLKNKPYYMMWMAANERSHYNLYRYVWSPYCAKKFGQFLMEKYGEIDALNAAWNSDYASFDALLAARPEPLVIQGAKYEDFNAFSRLIVRTFNQKILRILRQEDPGRLIFTNRFMIHEVRGVFDNLDLYEDFDGIAVNIYPSNDVWGLDLSEKQYLTLLHEKTGKPLMICEWSVPARDSGYYDNPDRLDWSYPQVMDTQQNRARQVVQVSADLYNMPFMVGAHWFSWGDFKHATRQSNRGLFHADGVTPYQPVLDALGGVNAQIKNR